MKSETTRVQDFHWLLNHIIAFWRGRWSCRVVRYLRGSFTLSLLPQEAVGYACDTSPWNKTVGQCGATFMCLGTMGLVETKVFFLSSIFRNARIFHDFRSRVWGLMGPSAEQKICQGEDVSYDRDIRHIIRRAVFSRGAGSWQQDARVAGIERSSVCWREEILWVPPLEILSCVSIVQRSRSHAHTQPPGGQSTAEDFGRDSAQTQWTSSRDVQRVAAWLSLRMWWEGGRWRDQNLISSTESILNPGTTKAHFFPMSCPTRAQVQLCGFAGKI